MTKRTQTPIAIIGLGALLPESRNVAEAWRNIVTGADLMSDLPDGHWRVEDYYDADPKAPDKTYAKRGGFLPKVDFDPMGFGIPPSIMPATDTSQLLALMVAERCLEDATGGDLAGLDRERISTLLGVTSTQELLGTMNSRLQRPVWVKAMREAGLPEDEVQDICERISSHYVPWQESSFPGLLGNVVAGRIANRFDLRGTNAVTDAACASSLAALRMGINELELGHADMVLGGGVDTMNDIFMYMCFSKTPALSPTGDCRPFSDSADGTMLGEGLVMFALMRLDDAEAQGRQVYGVIKGIGSSSDGRAKSVYAPLAAGQARAVRRAYEAAGFGPETVELVEAHGTGTKAGDAAEFEGLELVFGDVRQDKQWCALGSIKSQIGHTKSSAGAAGLLKAVLALHHKVLPPTAKVARPNPKLNIEQSPFYLSTEARPWIRSDDHPRRAGVSAFGFGGSNFHVAVEEYTGTAARPVRVTAAPGELWLFSAATGADVLAAGRAAAAAVGDFSFRAAANRRAFDASQPARLSLIAADADALLLQLDKAAANIGAGTSVSTPKGLRFEIGNTADSSTDGNVGGNVAFLFPGQGSQYVGMGADVAMGLDAARAVWDRVASHRFDGQAVHDLTFAPPPFTDAGRTAQTAALTATEWAQPAIGVSSLALLAVLQKLGVKASSVAGHSYGELTALHAAGVLTAADHLRVSRKRGELMRDAASTPGSMTVVTADADKVRGLLESWNLGVVLANHNSPTQAVISGPTDAIIEAESRLKAENMRFKRLNVATAFHSDVVSASCQPFAAFLANMAFAAPTMPVFSNSTAAPYSGDDDAMRALLSGQIAKPVRFVEQIEAMYAAGTRTFIEVGPGSVLSGLVGRILGDRAHTTVPLDRNGKNGLTSLQRGLGQLACLGIAMDFASLEGEFGTIPPIKPKAKMTIAINGSNYGKPYPLPGASTPKPNGAREPEVRTVVETVIEKVVEKVVETVIEYVEVPAEVHVEVPVAAATAGAFATQAAAASPNWISAYQELQRQTADAHAAYQRATTETHSAFLRTAEASITTLGAMLTGAAPSQTAMAFAAPVSTPAPIRVAAPIAAPAPVAVAPMAVTAVAAAPVAAATVVEAPVAVAPIAVAPVAVAAAAVAPAPATPVAAAAVDLEALMMDVVAEKTGYPVEMLGMEMELEADLGVDSIKRVEILSSVRERAPSVGEIDPSELASLNTLAEIVTHLRAKMPATTGASASAAPASAAPTSGGGLDLEALMMQVVAEKTGYPVEMLGMEMELEADLGVDSIKRVEILSSMREQAPELGEIDPNALASLNTLAEIVAHLGGTLPQMATASTTPSATTAASAGLDLEALMMVVVAEKTGYPVEMLGMEMELEADLGVDSIKRVEILSSMREQAPELGEIDPSALASLNTLAEIVSHLRGTLPASATATATAASTAGEVDLEALMMAVVSEKTGYPVEMLGMDMELEADLGVDSIKRVEILSSVRERAPGMAELDPSDLASLNTLAEIVSHLRGKDSGDFAGTASSSSSSSDDDAEGDQPSAMARAAEAAGVKRFAVRAERVTAPGLATAGLHTAKRLVVTPADSLAEAVAGLLTAAGVQAEALDVVPEDADGVIYLGGLQDVADRDEALAVNVDAFAVVRGLAPRFAQRGGLLVTVQDTGGDFGLSGRTPIRAWTAGIAALARTAACEWPDATVRALDISTTDSGGDALEDHVLAGRIAAELLLGGSNTEIGIDAAGARITLKSKVIAHTGSSVRLNAESVVVASGGARGVTAASLIALAKKTQATLILLGRTPLTTETSATRDAQTEAALKKAVMQQAIANKEKVTPAIIGKRAAGITRSREVRATIAAMEAAGSTVRYLAVDVTDSAALTDALTTVRADFGAITAIVHGAGVLADKLLADKTDAQFARVFDTKTKGLIALLDATANDPLRAICLFSSVAARAGNVGQSDYAMANEVLNAVACAERIARPEAAISAIGWGPWAGGMVTPQLKAHFERAGVALVPLDVGAHIFVNELTERAADTTLVVGSSAGASSLRAGETRSTVTEAWINATNHPEIGDHRIEGVAVVPVALATELLIRGAADFAGAPIRGLRQLQVLRGIKLPGFDTGSTAGTASGDCLIVHASDGSNGVAGVAVELRSSDGALHYRGIADVSMDADAALPTLVATPTPTGLAPWQLRDDIYDGHLLFHGPRFHVITAIKLAGKSGLMATAVGAMTLGWKVDGLHTDPALTDAALQAALLWAEVALGGATLPMGYDELVLGVAGPIDGPVEVVVTAGTIAARKATCSVQLRSDGQTIATMRNINLVMRPGEPRRSAAPSSSGAAL